MQPTEPDEATFGGYLRALRRSRGMSQRELARLSFMDFTYISKVENNRMPHTPSESFCLSLSQALQTDSWEMLRRAGKLPTPLLKKLLAMPVERWREIERSAE